MQYVTKKDKQSLFSKAEGNEYKVCDLQNALLESISLELMFQILIGMRAKARKGV